MRLYYESMLSLPHISATYSLPNLLYKLQEVLLPAFYKVNLREYVWFAQSHMANKW